MNHLFAIIFKNVRQNLILILFVVGITSCSSENPIIIEVEEINKEDSISGLRDSTSNNDSIDSAVNDSTVNDSIINNIPNTIKEDTLFVDTLIFAHWNIGNFSNGKTNNTTITPEQFISIKNAYINFIDSVNADIWGICEFNPKFSTNDSLAQKSIFPGYQYASIGIKHIYNCNAIFSKTIPLQNDFDVVYEQRAQHRYYRIAHIRINSETIKIIVSHLDWNQGENGAEYRRSQIQELVESFSDDKYVIISADFNISDLTELEPFKKAGYIMSSDKEKDILYTFPASNPSEPLDNIIVKGFDIIQTNIFQDRNLSDHCVISSKLAFKHY